MTATTSTTGEDLDLDLDLDVVVVDDDPASLELAVEALAGSITRSARTLAEALAQPSTGTGTSPLGFSETPPFYRIDWKTRTMMPRGPLSDRDWDTIFAVMREHRLTGVESSAVTDSAMRRLSELEHVTRINIGGAQQITDDPFVPVPSTPRPETWND